MPLLKDSEEARKLMERVRNARQHFKQLPLLPVLKDVKDTNVQGDEMELPKYKFMLLLNIVKVSFGVEIPLDEWMDSMCLANILSLYGSKRITWLHLSYIFVIFGSTRPYIFGWKLDKCLQ